MDAYFLLFMIVCFPCWLATTAVQFYGYAQDVASAVFAIKIWWAKRKLLKLIEKEKQNGLV